jgi:hypothetical protein
MLPIPYPSVDMMRLVVTLFLLQACTGKDGGSDLECSAWSPCCAWACAPRSDQNWGCDMECDTATTLGDPPGECVAVDGECVWE